MTRTQVSSIQLIMWLPMVTSYTRSNLGVSCSWVQISCTVSRTNQRTTPVAQFNFSPLLRVWFCQRSKEKCLPEERAFTLFSFTLFSSRPPRSSRLFYGCSGVDQSYCTSEFRCLKSLLQELPFDPNQHSSEH